MESSSKQQSATASAGPIYIHRFAVRIDPPTLVVEYGHRGGGDEPPRMMLKYIKIRSSPQKTAAHVVDKLVASFPELLGERTANRDQLEALVARIIDHGKGGGLANTSQGSGGAPGRRRGDEAAAAAGCVTAASDAWGRGDEFGDLNKASDAEVRAAKAKMDAVFEAHRLRAGQAGFEYDRRVDFEAPDSDAPADWDDESGGEEDEVS